MCIRITAWLRGIPLARTRRSAFARLKPQVGGLPLLTAEVNSPAVSYSLSWTVRSDGPCAFSAGCWGETAHQISVREKLTRWFWCGVFGELYGGATDQRYAKDLPDVLAYVYQNNLPSTIQEAVFSEWRLTTLRTRNSAAYKGIYALLTQRWMP